MGMESAGTKCVHGVQPLIAHREATSTRRSSEPAARSAAAPPARVLAVDDTASNLALLEQLLRREGYDVLTARDGHEAFERVIHDSPDLIISDVMMPRTNGFELCRAIKAHPAARLIPVVLVTSLDASSDRIRGIDAGADDFLRKPYDPHELRARIRSLLRLKRYTDDLDSAESVILSLSLIHI